MFDTAKCQRHQLTTPQLISILAFSLPAVLAAPRTNHTINRLEEPNTPPPNDVATLLADATEIVGFVDDWSADVSSVLGDVSQLLQQAVDLDATLTSGYVHAENIIGVLLSGPANPEEQQLGLTNAIKNIAVPTDDEPDARRRQRRTTTDIEQRAPAPVPVVGQIPTSVNCAGRIYSASAISATLQTACHYWFNWINAGTSGYPHTFGNFENIPQISAVSGPYGEFPILGSNVFSGGSVSPGPDRIIFTYGSCKFVGLITHTGASAYNRFVGC